LSIPSKLQKRVGCGGSRQKSSKSPESKKCLKGETQVVLRKKKYLFGNELKHHYLIASGYFAKVTKRPEKRRAARNRRPTVWGVEEQKNQTFGASET
jgi:hypothetical protein